MTPSEFIQVMAPLHQKYAKKYGFKIASAGIAQACLESGYGTSKKAKFNNFHGLKYRKNRVNCNSGYFEDGGSEQNPDGTYTLLPSDTAWYAFSDMDHAVEGYYQFLNVPNYTKAKIAEDPLVYLQAIKAAGYASSLKYVQNVFKVIEDYNLTQYDNFNNQEIEKQKKEEKDIGLISILQKTNTHNTTPKDNRKIDWIVLHYTAGTNSAKSAAAGIARYFATTPNQASADFIVDDVDIVQYNPDPKNMYCWAVGGKKYSSLCNSLAAKYYDICKNNNSISIEMCSRKKNTNTLNASDDDWYLTEATVNNAVILTKYLMKVYNIKADHVIMHNMVTGKWCPQPWCKNEDALKGWYDFQRRLGNAGARIPQPNVAPTGSRTSYTVKVTVPALNIRKGPGTSYPVVGVIKDQGIYTIVEENGNWGRLKSGVGWISLNYTNKQG